MPRFPAHSARFSLHFGFNMRFSQIKKKFDKNNFSQYTAFERLVKRLLPCAFLPASRTVFATAIAAVSVGDFISRIGQKADQSPARVSRRANAKSVDEK